MANIAEVLASYPALRLPSDMLSMLQALVGPRVVFGASGCSEKCPLPDGNGHYNGTHYHCMICGYSTNRKSNAEVHETTHQGDSKRPETIRKEKQFFDLMSEHFPPYARHWLEHLRNQYEILRRDLHGKQIEIQILQQQLQAMREQHRLEKHAWQQQAKKQKTSAFRGPVIPLRDCFKLQDKYLKFQFTEDTKWDDLGIGFSRFTPRTAGIVTDIKLNTSCSYEDLEYVLKKTQLLFFDNIEPGPSHSSAQELVTRALRALHALEIAKYDWAGTFHMSFDGYTYQQLHYTMMVAFFFLFQPLSEQELKVRLDKLGAAVAAIPSTGTLEAKQNFVLKAQDAAHDAFMQGEVKRIVPGIVESPNRDSNAAFLSAELVKKMMQLVASATNQDLEIMLHLFNTNKGVIVSDSAAVNSKIADNLLMLRLPCASHAVQVFALLFFAELCDLYGLDKEQQIRFFSQISTYLRTHWDLVKSYVQDDDFAKLWDKGDAEEFWQRIDQVLADTDAARLLRHFKMIDRYVSTRWNTLLNIVLFLVQNRQKLLNFCNSILAETRAHSKDDVDIVTQLRDRYLDPQLSLFDHTLADAQQNVFLWAFSQVNRYSSYMMPFMYWFSKTFKATLSHLSDGTFSLTRTFISAASNMNLDIQSAMEKARSAAMVILSNERNASPPPGAVLDGKRKTETVSSFDQFFGRHFNTAFMLAALLDPMSSQEIASSFCALMQSLLTTEAQQKLDYFGFYRAFPNEIHQVATGCPTWQFPELYKALIVVFAPMPVIQDYTEGRNSISKRLPAQTHPSNAYLLMRYHNTPVSFHSPEFAAIYLKMMDHQIEIKHMQEEARVCGTHVPVRLRDTLCAEFCQHYMHGGSPGSSRGQPLREAIANANRIIEMQHAARGLLMLEARGSNRTLLKAHYADAARQIGLSFTADEPLVSLIFLLNCHWFNREFIIYWNSLCDKALRSEEKRSVPEQLDPFLDKIAEYNMMSGLKPSQQYFTMGNTSAIEELEHQLACYDGTSPYRAQIDVHRTLRLAKQRPIPIIPTIPTSQISYDEDGDVMEISDSEMAPLADGHTNQQSITAQVPSSDDVLRILDQFGIVSTGPYNIERILSSIMLPFVIQEFSYLRNIHRTKRRLMLLQSKEFLPLLVVLDAVRSGLKHDFIYFLRRRVQNWSQLSASGLDSLVQEYEEQTIEIDTEVSDPDGYTVSLLGRPVIASLQALCRVLNGAVQLLTPQDIAERDFTDLGFGTARPSFFINLVLYQDEKKSIGIFDIGSIAHAFYQVPPDLIDYVNEADDSIARGLSNISCNVYRREIWSDIKAIVVRHLESLKQTRAEVAGSRQDNPSNFVTPVKNQATPPIPRPQSPNLEDQPIDMFDDTVVDHRKPAVVRHISPADQISTVPEAVQFVRRTRLGRRDVTITFPTNPSDSSIQRTIVLEDGTIGSPNRVYPRDMEMLDTPPFVRAASVATQPASAPFSIPSYLVSSNDEDPVPPLSPSVLEAGGFLHTEDDDLKPQVPQVEARSSAGEVLKIAAQQPSVAPVPAAAEHSQPLSDLPAQIQEQKKSKRVHDGGNKYSSPSGRPLSDNLYTEIRFTGTGSSKLAYVPRKSARRLQKPEFEEGLTKHSNRGQRRGKRKQAEEATSAETSAAATATTPAQQSAAPPGSQDHDDIQSQNKKRRLEGPDTVGGASSGEVESSKSTGDSGER